MENYVFRHLVAYLFLLFWLKTEILSVKGGEKMKKNNKTQKNSNEIESRKPTCFPKITSNALSN